MLIIFFAKHMSQLIVATRIYKKILTVSCYMGMVLLVVNDIYFFADN